MKPIPVNVHKFDGNQGKFLIQAIESRWNFRLANIQAAIGLAQLEKLDQTISRKRWIGNKYNELLDGCVSLQLPLPKTFYAKNLFEFTQWY